MDISKNISIEQLGIDGVIIHTTETVNYKEQTIVLNASKIHYPNNDTGIEKLKDAMAECKHIYDAVLLVWNNNQDTTTGGN